MVDSKRLAIYLNDHLAAAIGGGELAGRSAGANRGTALGTELERLAQEIDEDRRVLKDLMRELGVSVDPAKAAGAWTAEKLGRLKLNGNWLSYSPLSRLEELEILIVGIEGKILLWESLAQHPELAGRARPDLAELVRRGRAQRRRLNRHRLEAARAAF
jgi:hypothetical protein